jgi:hypothetical protein
MTVKKTKIIVTKRSGDYHAQIEGHPGLWDAGYSRPVAIGNLIISHQDALGFKVVTK